MGWAMRIGEKMKEVKVDQNVLYGKYFQQQQNILGRKTKFVRVQEMAPCVKMLAAHLDILTLVPRVHTVREN